eukprot:SAG22_NODE_399_length_11094_cov_5.593452_8_plen_389_part_00
MPTGFRDGNDSAELDVAGLFKSKGMDPTSVMNKLLDPLQDQIKAQLKEVAPLLLVLDQQSAAARATWEREGGKKMLKKFEKEQQKLAASAAKAEKKAAKAEKKASKKAKKAKKTGEASGEENPVAAAAAAAAGEDVADEKGGDIELTNRLQGGGRRGWNNAWSDSSSSDDEESDDSSDDDDGLGLASRLQGGEDEEAPAVAEPAAAEPAAAEPAAPEPEAEPAAAAGGEAAAAAEPEPQADAAGAVSNVEIPVADFLKAGMVAAVDAVNMMLVGLGETVDMRVAAISVSPEMRSSDIKRGLSQLAQELIVHKLHENVLPQVEVKLKELKLPLPVIEEKILRMVRETTQRNGHALTLEFCFSGMLWLACFGSPASSFQSAGSPPLPYHR